jgi:F-type H+-transporting ATPase subunit delta
VVGLLRILFERKRVDLIPGVADAFAQRVRAHRGIELADVTTAVEIGEPEKALIAERLARRTGRTVELETHVDPAILGGVVARVGDQLFDGSVRGKLEALRKRLEGTRRA